MVPDSVSKVIACGRRADSATTDLSRSVPFCSSVIETTRSNLVPILFDHQPPHRKKKFSAPRQCSSRCVRAVIFPRFRIAETIIDDRRKFLMANGFDI